MPRRPGLISQPFAFATDIDPFVRRRDDMRNPTPGRSLDIRLPTESYRVIERLHAVGKRLGLAAILLCTASAVRAGGSAGEVTELSGVTVASTHPFGDVPSATIGTVYSEQLQYRPLTRVAEMLEVVPGLIVTQHSGEGKANQYFLRGFNLDHGTDFATFVDDMPVNLRTHAHGQGYSDLNFVIPELVDSIEYRKGPYYAQYGDFSAAGAADIRYKNRIDTPFAQATGGEYGYGRLVSAGSASVFGGEALYGIEGVHYDGPFVNGDNLNHGSLTLRFTHGVDDEGYHVEAMAYQGHWDATDQIPQRAVQQGLSEFGCIDCSDAGSSYRYSLSGGWHHRFGIGMLQTSAYAIRYHLDLYSDFTYFLNSGNGNIAALPDKSFSPDPSIPTDQFEQLDTRNIYGGQLGYMFTLPLAGVKLDNELGLQTRYDRVAPSGLYDTQERSRYFTVMQDRIGEWSGAAYVQTGLAFNPWSRALLGVRYDRYRFAVDSNIAGNSGAASAGIASPKLSLILGPFDKTDFFVNLGKGFHSNDARGVTQTQMPVSAASPTPGRADPATPLAAARGADVGLRTAFLPHTQIALSYFVLDLDSELTLSGDDGTTGIGPASRREGVESAVYWRPLRHFVVDADYAYTHARYRDSDNVGTHIEEAPTSIAALGLTFEDLRGWDGALRLRYFGPRPLVEDASVSSHATKLVNASLGYRFSPHWRVLFEGTNLFNSRDHDIDYFYTSRASPTDSPQNDIHFHPVEPINGRFIVTYSY
jgi:outer membrane receptor protein involved in Fe transport